MPLALEAPAPAIAFAQYRRFLPALTHLVRTCELLTLLVIAVYIGARTLPRTWSHLNTDFPNYYVTARLFREGYSTDRIYEWIWLQRQKDHMGITRRDQPLVGFVPHTPFSALPLWPLTYLRPLVAKQVWIAFNLLAVAMVAAVLRAITRLPWRKLALLIGLCFPLLRNLEYGQYYAVLLLVTTFALWLYLIDRRFLAGGLMGIGAGLKVFPALFLFYFVRKRDLPAAAGLIAGATLSLLTSILAFGMQLHRTYFSQVLPWALRGEVVDPYNLASNSLSSLLHRLFLFEPELNPHPWHNAPGAFAVLHPVLQLLVLAPAVFLAVPHDWEERRIQIEWSAFLVALLTISTLPASYHFTLLILPTAVLATHFMGRREYPQLTLLVLLYLAICFPAWPRSLSEGWQAFAAVPRLYFVLLFCFLCYTTLLRLRRPIVERVTERWIWAVAMTVVVAIQIAGMLRHQRGMYGDYRGRITTAPETLLSTEPLARGDTIDFIAMRTEGYGLATLRALGIYLNASSADELSETSDKQEIWIEEAGAQSRILRMGALAGPGRVEVDRAERPVVSSDGHWLAYLRCTQGRAAVWKRSLFIAPSAEIKITSPQFNVEEMAFFPDGSLVFAAATNGQDSALYLATAQGLTQPLDIQHARYPAVSSDGRWLVYSQLEHGVWNLWLRDMQTGATHRVTHADCNDVSPAWKADSKTLLYASDCGRGLGLTALYQRQVIP